MDPESLRLAFDVFQFFLTGALGLWIWMLRRGQATRAQIDAVDRRVIALETRLADAPTRESMHSLSLVVSQIEGDLKAIVERISGMGEVVKRIETVVNRQENFLLNKGGGQ